MASPKNESSPKNLFIKKTPFTPCRRVGLSRNTPKSHKNVLNNSVDVSTKCEKEVEDADLNITPSLCQDSAALDHEQSLTTPNTGGAYITPKREGMYRGVHKRRRLQNSVIKSNKPKNDSTIYGAVLGSDDADARVLKRPTPVSVSKKSNFSIPYAGRSATPNLSKMFEEGCSSNVPLKDDSNEDIDTIECTEEELLNIKERIKKKKQKVGELQEKLEERKKRQERLKNVTETWLRAGQDAIQELLTCYNNAGYSMSLSQLLDNLHIPYSLLHWNPQDEEFE